MLKSISENARQSGINFEDIFHRFNADQDAKLNEQEFGRLLLALGNTIDPEMIKHLFLRTDISGDGFITIREFKRTLFGIEAADFEEDDNVFLASIIEEL